MVARWVMVVRPATWSSQQTGVCVCVKITPCYRVRVFVCVLLIVVV